MLNTSSVYAYLVSGVLSVITFYLCISTEEQRLLWLCVQDYAKTLILFSKSLKVILACQTSYLNSF